MKSRVAETDIAVFEKKLAGYKSAIDEDIKAYAKHVQKTTLQQYGKYARLEVDAFLSVLQRGGKRIRGALTMLGYEMSGGIIDLGAWYSHLDAGGDFSASTAGMRTKGTLTEERRGKSAASAKSSSRVIGSAGEQATAVRNTRMIIQAARAVEMIQAYILIIDDIQDRSIMRRGGPAAHVTLADYHEKHELAADSDHFGVSIALNAALSGAHAAQMIMANMDASEESRLKVLSILNRTMMVTAHGQTSDIMNEVIAEVSLEDVERVMEWKTAHYTFLNPLHMGMVLAGADCHDTDAITEYALNAGKVYQITDDILGTFGSEFDSGKSPMDDIREGKRTLLTYYALDHVSSANKNFLVHMLGNANLTPAEFYRCRDIIQESGALDYARAEAALSAQLANQALRAEKDRWTAEGVEFLSGLAEYLLTRTR